MSFYSLISYFIFYCLFYTAVKLTVYLIQCKFCISLYLREFVLHGVNFKHIFIFLLSLYSFLIFQRVLFVVFPLCSVYPFKIKVLLCFCRTALVGVGAPPVDSFSVLVVSMMVFGLGTPLLLLLVGGVCVCVRKRAAAPSTLAYEPIN